MKGGTLVIGEILLLLLLVLLVSTIPAWSHSRSWGYRPSGTVGMIVLVVLILLLLGVL